MSNNINKQKEQLRDRLIKASLLGYDKLNDMNRVIDLKRAKFKHNYVYYRNMVYMDSSEEGMKKMDIELEFVETDEQRDIWKYYKLHTSSIQTDDSVGRRFQILVKDKTSNKYIGLLRLGDDLFYMDRRDIHLGWKNDEESISNEDRSFRLKHIINAHCCVGLQPVSFNFHIGKLLMMLCFSREVQEYYFKRYGNYIAGIITTSINGESKQYDRIRGFKYLKETKGQSLIIPLNLYNECIDFLKKTGVNLNDSKSKSIRSRSKLLRYKRILKEFGLDRKMFFTNRERGVYFGFTSKDSKSFLSDMNIKKYNPSLNEFGTVKEITEFWKDRWATQRIRHLNETGRVKNTIDFYDLSRKDKLVEYKKLQRENLKLALEEEYNNINNRYARLYYARKKLVEYDKEYIVDKYPDLQIDKSYAACIFDCICKLVFYKDTLSVAIFIENIDKIIIELMQKYYGGNIYIKDNRYIYILYDTELNTLFNDISEHVVCKHDIINSIIELTENRNELLFGKIVKMNDDIDNYKIRSDKINEKYLAALYDFNSINKIAAKYKDRFNYYSISFKGINTMMNDELVKYFAKASIDKKYTILTSDEIIGKLTELSKYVIINKEVINVMMDFINDRIKNKRKYDDTIHTFRKGLYDKLIESR